VARPSSPADREGCDPRRAAREQYLEPEARALIEVSIQEAAGSPTGGPVVWLRMEPGEDHIAGMRLTAVEGADGREQLLAYCEDHGPPVAWEA
jgi:hypothetical protein